MKMHNLSRLFLITFDEVYLLDYLVSNNGTSIPMGPSSKAIKAFIAIIRL